MGVPNQQQGDAFTVQGGWQPGEQVQMPGIGSINVPQEGLTQAEYNALNGLREGNPVGGPFAERILHGLVNRGVLFIDPMNPPDMNLLFHDDQVAAAMNAATPEQRQAVLGGADPMTALGGGGGGGGIHVDTGGGNTGVGGPVTDPTNQQFDFPKDDPNVTVGSPPPTPSQPPPNQQSPPNQQPPPNSGGGGGQTQPKPKPKPKAQPQPNPTPDPQPKPQPKPKAQPEGPIVPAEPAQLPYSIDANGRRVDVETGMPLDGQTGKPPIKLPPDLNAPNAPSTGGVMPKNPLTDRDAGGRQVGGTGPVVGAPPAPHVDPRKKDRDQLASLFGGTRLY